MRPSDFKIGETYGWDSEKDIVITDIERRDEQTTITFDIFAKDLFGTKLGWSFYVFYGNSEIEWWGKDNEPDDDNEEFENVSDTSTDVDICCSYRLSSLDNLDI